MKILVFTKNWLGDVLFEFPALDSLRAYDPEAEIVCAAPARCVAMLKLHPAVHHVIAFDEKGNERSLWKKILWVWRMRKGRWDLAVLFHRSRTRALISFLGGAKKRIGYACRREAFLTTAVEEPSESLHQVDYFLNLLKKAGLPVGPGEGRYKIVPPKEAREKIHKFLRAQGLTSFVCFHLGANWEPKRWPVAHYAASAEILWRKWQLPVILTGAQADALLADQLLKLVRKAKVLNEVGKTTLGELAALFEKARFVVSGDSGPMHVASAVGTRVVALFGPTDPKLTGPRGVGEVEILQHIPEGYKIPWVGSELPSGGWLSRIAPDSMIERIESKGWLEPDPNRRDGGPLQPEARRDPPMQILLVSLSNLGDSILTLPVLMSLGERFPGAQFHVVTGPRAAGLFQNSRFVSRLLIYDKKKGFAHQWKFLRLLRAEHYDLVVDLRNTAIPFLVRTQKRSPLMRPYKKIAMRERHLEVLEWMGLGKNGSLRPFDFFTEEESKRAFQKLHEKGILKDQGYILVAAAAASGLKTWRLEGFREVLKRLVEEREEPLLLVGDKREREIVNPLTEIHPARVVNLCGELTFRETAAVMSRALLLLTNDSALMHLGYEIDRPVVAVFGPTHHEKYGRTGPHFKIVRAGSSCSPCERPRCRFKRQYCFEDLESEKVYEACQGLLEHHVSA